MNYFKDWEFSCKCNCGKNNMQYETKLMLDVARWKADVEFVINSGCRCEEHNKRVKGSPNSSHLKGLAVDIRYRDEKERFKIIEGLLYAGFKRIGIGGDYIHADNDKSKTAGVIWLYDEVVK